MVQGHQEVDFFQQILSFAILDHFLPKGFHGPQQPCFLVLDEEHLSVCALAQYLADFEVFCDISLVYFVHKHIRTNSDIEIAALPHRGHSEVTLLAACRWLQEEVHLLVLGVGDNLGGTPRLSAGPGRVMGRLVN